MGTVLAVVPACEQERTGEELGREFPGHDIHVFESADQLGSAFGTRTPDLLIFPLTLPAVEQEAVAALLEQWDPGGRHGPGASLSASAKHGASDREWFYWLKPVNKTPPDPRPPATLPGEPKPAAAPQLHTPPVSTPPVDTTLQVAAPDAPPGARSRAWNRGVDTGRVVVVRLLRVAAHAAAWSGRSLRAASVLAWRGGKRSVQLALPWIRVSMAAIWASRAVVFKLATVILLIAGVGVLGRGATRFLPTMSRTRAEAAPAPKTASGSEVENRAVKPVLRRGQLNVTSEPSGALIYVDGERRGATPLLIDNLTPGQHVVTLTQGSNTVKHVVKVKTNETATLDAPIYSGWVALFAPFELQVWDGGRPIILDERNRVMLSPGSHELQLANTALGYRGTQVVNVRPMEVTPVSLVAPQSAITVTCSAPSEVWIDGVHVGQTPLEGQPVDIGTREIVCRNPALGEKRVTATVTTKPLRVNIDF